MEVAPKNDINRHISQEILRQLIQKKSFLLKSLVLKNHLRKCQRCSEIVNIKNYLQQIAGRTKPVESESHPDTSDLDDSMARIYDSSLSKQEAADFLHHISSCSQCFEYVSFVLEDSLTPVPEAIEQQIAALTDISLAAIVLKEIPPQESIFQKILSKMKKRFDQIKEGGIVPIPEPRPVPGSIKGPWARKLEKILVPQLVYALELLIAVGGGGFGGYRYYVTTHRINQAHELLVENHRLYMADTPRLSGGYASTGIGMLMDEDAPPSFLSQAFDLTEQAIENGSKSVQAKQLQAQIFIIQKEYNKADSVFNLIADRDRHLAAVLNDLGVLKYKKEEWQEAIEYFEATIQVNSDFKEAYYNLALAQNKLGKKQEAISTLDEYLKFKNDVGWKNAALNFLQKLREEISKNKI